nr:thioesterase domain-containing protein [Streptomyces sp. NBC_00830]
MPRGDDEIVAEIQGFGTEGSAALDDPDLRELLLPMIRADYRLVETYQPERTGRLSTPFAVLRGSGDDKVTPEGAAAWRALTAARCTEHVFDGGHFYLRENEPPVLDTLTALIARALR